MCWNPSGDFVASVSEDSVRVWSLGSGSEGECVHELNCNGNKFHSCVFHPTHPSLLVIGCYQASFMTDILPFILRFTFLKNNHFQYNLMCLYESSVISLSWLFSLTPDL